MFHFLCACGIRKKGGFFMLSFEGITTSMLSVSKPNV